MKSARSLSVICFYFYFCCLQSAPAQELRSSEATFPKRHGAVGPSDVSTIPFEVSVDFTSVKGEFSPYLFMLTDSLDPGAHDYQSAKDTQFEVIALSQLTEDKARSLTQHDLEGAINFAASEPMAPGEIEKQLDTLITTIDELKKKFPSLRIKAFLFGYEPDFPDQIFFKGTKEEFFQNYGRFARYLKSRDRTYLAGGGNFSSFSGDWPRDFIRFCYEEKIPLDVVSFHRYSPEVKKGFLEAIRHIQRLLIEFPMPNKPKIAVTEWDIQASSFESKSASEEAFDGWKAAHNILALIAMADHGVWMAPTAFRPLLYAHKAFNALSGKVPISVRGNDFQACAVAAGKSRDSQSLVIVLANYDPNGFSAVYGRSYGMLPGESPLADRIDTIVSYRKYRIKIENLPWLPSDRLTLERYVIEGSRRLELEEVSDYQGSSSIVIARDISVPSVQLIKLYKK